MPTTNPFSPLAAGTVSLAVTTSSSRVAISGANGVENVDLRVYNTGSSAARIRLGGSTVAATSADMLVAAGAETVIGGLKYTYLAAICPTGSTTLEITTGRGV